MSQNEYLLIGTYLALFAGPVLSFVFWKRDRVKGKYVIAFTALMVLIGVLAIRFGISFAGVMADATFVFITYVLVSISALKLTNYKSWLFKITGISLFVPLCGLAFISIPAFLGVVFAVADFETEYEQNADNGLSCRVSSYGNATTYNGGYNVTIFKVYGPIEKETDFESVESTRNPEITPQKVCGLALNALKS